MTDGDFRKVAISAVSELLLINAYVATNRPKPPQFSAGGCTMHPQKRRRRVKIDDRSHTFRAILNAFIHPYKYVPASNLNLYRYDSRPKTHPPKNIHVYHYKIASFIALYQK